ncbi:hypothetical protein [Dongia sp.]|uniref:hypothetical protein n=1 Tax=Dongia sp. TaxID=1977262 RepID=UPI0035B3ED94
MGRKNPFVRMNWLQRAPRLVQDDVMVLQLELRRLYPQMVLFPKRYHFHELGQEVGRPAFIEDMIEHFQPWIKASSRFGYTSGEPIAVRVPWPEEIASNNPQRLIGRPHRRPFDDSPEAFRRFGRTVYFGPRSSICYSGIILDLPNELIVGTGENSKSNIRVLAECDGFEMEIPYDTEDEEVVAFVKSITSIITRLGSSAYCYYDCVTGEALFMLHAHPASKSFMKRCAMEPGLYLYLEHGTVNGHPIGIGPTPAQRRKWRREAGLGDDPKLQNPPSITLPEYSAWHRDRLQKYPDEVFKELRRLKSEAFFRYMQERDSDAGGHAGDLSTNASS